MPQFVHTAPPAESNEKERIVTVTVLYLAGFRPIDVIEIIILSSSFAGACISLGNDDLALLRWTRDDGALALLLFLTIQGTKNYPLAAIGCT